MTEHAAHVPTPRVGGRVLLLDPDDRVLLIHERIDDGRTHWLTPGGGVEVGESPATAAVREVLEEIGMHVQLIADEPVLVTRRLWSWASVTYDQTDHFYLAHSPRGFEPRPRGLTAMERQTLVGYGWWTVAQLRDTEETLLPPDLGDVLAALLREPGRPG